MRILLVDDEVELVSALAERLSFRGFDADYAASAEDALSLAEKNVYALAVLDVKMPRMSGLELREKLEALRPGMRYIFLTGHGSEDDFAAGSRAAESYLVKPVRIEVLVAEIRAALGMPEEP